jgi:hypothetical protein
MKTFLIDEAFRNALITLLRQVKLSNISFEEIRGVINSLSSLKETSEVIPNNADPDIKPEAK